MSKMVQRGFIWLIAIVMVIGTIGMFVGIILANDNNARQQEDISRARQQIEEQQRQQAACQATSPPEGAVYDKPEPVVFDKDSVTEVRTEDVVVGEGAEITSIDDCVTVHYLGNTPDGSVFDNSYDRGEPIAFPLSGVILGWQEGLIGMKVGGARKIWIPADKAYGESGNPPSIGPNEPLFFYVELIDVK